MNQKSNVEESNTTGTILIIIIGMVISFAFGKSCSDNYNPRSAIKGIDTIYTKDSFYKVHISIDTVLEKENNNDPPERQ